ncbi:Non-reducing end beta-L-arabinofuranosidase [Pleurostoma richardsiae]|uniref:Non-reducing end beta-L-arabinofuranosidase n=1 Tax=Pleurostoma richardsiae TaxID=41990 RepID=A0AA38VKE8_9PEZI|nr:Non-reducing end beta-L-arabinofuranosidase [Pleurostoma richardsiae]
MANPQTTFHHTTFHGESTLSIRRNKISRVTLQTQLELLRKTGRYDCFELKWHSIYDDKSHWPVPPHQFWDSDLGKWIESACYFLMEEYDAEIDAAVRYMVKTMRTAQREDGYLNLHYIVVEPGKRWTNIRDMHEFYNAGHLIEAALAHYQYYKNTEFLDVMEKYVALMSKTFGPGKGQLRAYPGHPEIELSLLRLYKVTKNVDAYNLARFFLEERGNPTGQEGKHYYDWEMERRGESPYKRPNSYPMTQDYWYCQAHAPIKEQQTVEGHAVRSMYLLIAVADLIALDRDGAQPLRDASTWFSALTGLWDNMVDKKMYLTGGIGAVAQWEGFGIDYFLPQGTDEGGCYAETCASIGVMMLAERLLYVDLSARYADVMELCLYNNVMTAMSLDGKAFTYENQLASSLKMKSAREEWFECSCCPPNLTRLFGSLGGYMWHFGGQKQQAFVNVHLYTTAKLEFKVGGAPLSLEQKSNWPWEGNVMFQLSAPAGIETTIRLRIPGWAEGDFVLTPSCKTAKVEKGYLVLDPAYTAANPSFSLVVGGFKPRYIAPHPYTNQRTLTLARGPFVYCVEDYDNPWEKDHFRNVVLKEGSPVTEEERFFEKQGEPYVALRTVGWERSMKSWTSKPSGASPGTSTGEDSLGSQRELVFVPYYFRANRGGQGHMRVGLLKA